MPVKDKDKVYFKIKSGAINTGVYDAKTKMVMMSGGKRAKPPKRALHHTRKGAMDNQFVDLTKTPTKKDLTKTPTKKAQKKERKKVYYIEAHMLSEEEEEIMLSDDWKVYKITPYKTFLKKSMTKKDADMDSIWDSKDSFADHSISKMLK